MNENHALCATPEWAEFMESRPPPRRCPRRGRQPRASQGLHEFHEGDTYNPIDPARMLVFLQAAGFGRVTVSVGDGLLFTARKAPEERRRE